VIKLMMIMYKLDGDLSADRLVRELPSIVCAIPTDYIREQRWFGSKAQTIKSVNLFDFILLSRKLPFYILMLVKISFDKSFEIYNLPVGIGKVKKSSSLGETSPPYTIMEILAAGQKYHLYNAFIDTEFLTKLFKVIDRPRRANAQTGYFNSATTRVFRDWKKKHSLNDIYPAHSMKVEQSNTSVVYNDKFILKNIRKLENGTNPDLEVPLFLTTRTGFENIPLVAGYINYADGKGFNTTIASMQKFIPNQGDGWKYTLDHLEQFYKYINKLDREQSLKSLNTKAAREKMVLRLSNNYLMDMYILGRITGGLHNALSSDPGTHEFAPQLISRSDIKIWISSIRRYIDGVLNDPAIKKSRLPVDIRRKVNQVIANTDLYLMHTENLNELLTFKMNKTRYHGDYHLGQVLKTKNSFIIIDFEGEPARSINERRSMQSPLKDVAGMLRSFNYAVYSALFSLSEEYKDASGVLEKWGIIWEEQVKKTFMNGYLDSTCRAKKGKKEVNESSIMKILAVFQIEKAVYELRYELNNRPEWARIPLQYLLSIIK